MQSSTVSLSTSSVSSLTANATTTFPASANGTFTLSSHGTATATVVIVNGTTVNATATPTATSSAAFPTLSGVSVCVTNCLQSSVSQANCSTIVDVACYCSSSTFRNSTINCVETQCPQELQGAESLAQRFCSLVSVTLTFPSPTSTSPTGESAPTTSPKAGSARGLRGPVAQVTSCLFAGLAWLVLNW